MDEETSSKTGGLSPQYKTYERQKCFVAHSHGARWCDDVVNICNQVLPEFGLEPWYAADHFDPTKPLRDKVVELIANTRYGIYDLSYWRKDDKSEWHMPRNVLIELGVAIALNRPTLLLRHAENRISGLQLPTCLESVSAHILEFSGGVTLQRILREHLSRWVHTPPEHDWWNRYCMFGNRICEYREAHPHGRQWGQETIRCHISDGQDADRLDFRGVVEEVLGRFSDVTFGYLDTLPMADGYDFLLCTHCQAVRSTPFAIYRITPQTPAETFLAIGMSLALEKQFTHRIPKILLTTNKHDIPSLLSGYEVVEARNDQECKTYLRKFMPDVIREVRKTTWRPRPLPFIEVVPKHVEKPAAEEEQDRDAQSDLVEEDVSLEQVADSYIGKIGKYGLIKEIGSGSFAIVYLARDMESNQIYAVKIMHPEHARDSSLTSRFQREAYILQGLSDPHIVRIIDYGNDGDVYYIVMEYVDGQSLKYYITTSGRIEPLRALNYARQIAEGLNTAYKQGVVHRHINPKTILINSQDMVKITDFGMARSKDTTTITGTDEFMGTPYYISPEQVDSGHLADTRSDLYSLAIVLFETLTGRPPFEGGSIIDIVIKHKKDRIPSISRIRPNLPADMDAFFQKALAKTPAARYQTPREFITALEQLQQQIQAVISPPHMKTPVKQGYLIVISSGQSIPLIWELMLVGRQDPKVGIFPEINLADMKVGRRHAYLRNQQGTFTVEDLNSINKTRLNGVTLVPYQEYPLKDGDILRFGSVEVRFELRSMPPGHSTFVPLEQVAGPDAMLTLPGIWSPSPPQQAESVADTDEDTAKLPLPDDWTNANDGGSEKRTATSNISLPISSSTQHFADYTGQIIGNYYLTRKLASRLYSSVYLAQHRLFEERIVVMKLLHSRYLTFPQEQSKFYREVQLIQRFKHPHILSILDAGLHEGLPYILTEYASNGSLSDRLKGQFSHRLPSVHESLDILTQIGQALAFVHEQNILHRDIKPSNILFNAKGEALLADFGIAVILETDNDQAVDMVGTPRYMSPEQFQGKASKKSDQYALGCVAYELFTGSSPFIESDPISLAMKHWNEQPLAPRQLNSDVPVHIESAILKALEKDPNNRHADVMAFVTALGGRA